MNFKSVDKHILKEMGFISDQKGIKSRYKSEKKSWFEHLQHTQNYISESIQNTECENAIIFGSGWLYDVPVEVLSKKFNKVYLLDIAHQYNTKKIKKTFPNIEFIITDITGGFIESIYHFVLEYFRTKQITGVNEFERIKFHVPVQNSMLVSLNILNQLDILIVDYIKRFNIYSEDDIVKLRTIIQSNHIELLKNNESCLITDYEEILLSLDDKPEQTNNLIYCKFPEGKNIKKWQWKFDTKMRYYEDKKTYFNVIAMNI